MASLDFYEVRRGFYAALPMYLGFIPLALILGAQASQKGQNPFTAYLMTAINFAGGSEFAAVSLWNPLDLPVLMILLSTLLINSRHIIMGATLAPYLSKESGLRVFFIYYIMCDETWALSMQEIQRRQHENLKPSFCFAFHMGVGLSLWIMWTWSTFVGACIGSAFGDLTSWGFAMALPATFIGLSVAMRPRKDKSLYIPIAASFMASALTHLYIDTRYSVGMGALAGLFTTFFLFSYRQQKQSASTNPQTASNAAEPAELSEPAEPAEPAELAEPATDTASAATANIAIASAADPAPTTVQNEASPKN